MIYEDDDSDDDDDSASDDNAEEEEAAAEAVSHLFKEDDIIDYIAKSFLTEDCLDQERILEAAGHHVLQAKGMRYYTQKQPKRPFCVVLWRLFTMIESMLSCVTMHRTCRFRITAAVWYFRS
jgi:hypothetical protein